MAETVQRHPIHSVTRPQSPVLLCWIGLRFERNLGDSSSAAGGTGLRGLGWCRGAINSNAIDFIAAEHGCCRHERDDES